MASQHSWPSRCAGRRAGHFPIILRKLESFNYGGGGGYLAVSFRFFRCSMSQFFGLSSRFALTLLQIPEQASLSRQALEFSQEFSSTLDKTSPKEYDSRQTTTPQAVQSALHGLFSKIDSLHKPWTSLTHFTRQYSIYMQC